MSGKFYGSKGLVILVALLLSACAEPLFIPTLDPQSIDALQDGGYCRDQWGKSLDNLSCSQQYEDLARDYYKSQHKHLPRDGKTY